jgi:Na+/H+ antiporter NhaD/arsenite permease-like protein
LSFSLAVSIAVFTLIAIREWLPSFLKIWHVMTAGAVVLLISGTITPKSAYQAIDWNVMLYLFSVFSIGRALYENGISHRIAGWMVGWRTPGVSLVAFMLLFALVAAVLTNDAAAIIGTPIALMLASQTGADQKTFLVALCVAVTIGSMATPIGNPQNLLIAASGKVHAPMVTFVHWLIVPTLICLGGSALWLSKRMVVSTPEGEQSDLAQETEGTQWPVLSAIAVLIVLVTVESILAATGSDFGYPLGVAAAIACLPVYLFDGARAKTFVRLDWPTLVFFVAMFIVTGAVLKSGALQEWLSPWHDQLGEPILVTSIAFFGSQVFSNVPLVEIYLNLLRDHDTPTLMLLSGISTLAGNLFILSAASNVIIVQQSEKHGVTPFQFWQFTRYVLPVTVVSLLVCYLWVAFLVSVSE